MLIRSLSFLPNPQFFIQRSLYHSSLHSVDTDIAVKWSTKSKMKIMSEVAVLGLSPCLPKAVSRIMHICVK
jgi:hypothetical protein